MKITDVKTRIVAIPHVDVHKQAWGEKKGYVAAIVELLTDEGITGIGESCIIFPSAEITRLMIESVKPTLIDEDPFDVERITRRVWWPNFPHTSNLNFCAIEMALWDIIGKASNRPLYKMLGGLVRKRVEFMMIAKRSKRLAEMVAEAVQFKEQGFTCFYVKVGMDPDEDLAAIKMMREALGPTVKLIADANEVWSVGRAVKYIKAMERYDLFYMEQPTPAHDLDGMATLRKRVDTPICAHESARTLRDVSNVVRKEAADVIQVDPRTSEGILGCKKAAAIAEGAGLPLVMHNASGELGPSQAAIIHIAASTPNFIYPNQSMYYYLADDIITGERLAYTEGCMDVPDKPGLGVELNEDKMNKYEKHYRKVGADPFTRPDDTIPMTPRY
jgi:L-alanine-DL-glutamate epimerase-like enolase superfamily enzyme